MADATIGYLGHNNYASTSGQQQAIKRIIERTGQFKELEGWEVPIPEPSKDWEPTAGMLWSQIRADESSADFGAGDWAQAWIAVELLNRALTDPKRHTPSAQMIAEVFTVLRDLRLSQRQKMQDGILVNREPPTLSVADEFRLELKPVLTTP